MQPRAVGLVVACRAPAAGASSPRLVVITQADNGKTFRLVAGSRAELHFSGRWIWSPPVVRGNAVDLIQINYFRNPGYSGWTIESEAPGPPQIARRLAVL